MDESGDDRMSEWNNLVVGSAEKRINCK
jgi:hypothetical protein